MLHNWKPFVCLLCFVLSSGDISAQPSFSWARRMGAEINDWGNAITTDISGNVLTAGLFRGTVDFDPGPGVLNLSSNGFGAFVSKTDSSGNFIWAKSIGSYDNRVSSVVTDGAGNVYVAGIFQDTGDFDPGPGVYSMSAVPFRFNTYVVKLDSAGNFVWAKNFGGDFNTTIECLIIDKLGNLYAGGGFHGTTDFDPGPGVLNLTCTGSMASFVFKLTSTGDLVWAEAFMGQYAYLYSITSDQSGSSIYITGFFSGPVDFDPGSPTYSLQTLLPDFDMFVCKWDSSGSFQWAKQVGSALGNQVGNSIVTDSFGNIYTTGYFELATDFDPGPGIYNLSSAGVSQDIFILKLDNLGSFQWARQVGDTGRDVGNEIVSDGQNVYVTGIFENSPDFDPGVGNASLTSAGMRDMFVLKLNGQGTKKWAFRLGGTLNDAGLAITTDQALNVYTTGQFCDTVVDFDFGPGIFNMSAFSYSLSDIFIHKTAQQPDTALDVQPLSLSSFIISPNPSTSYIIVSYHQKGTLLVFDLQGRIIQKVDLLPGGRVCLDTNSWPSGLLLYRYLINGKTAESGRLLIQK